MLKHFCILVENKYLVWFEYADFLIWMNPGIAQTSYWQIWEYIYIYIKMTLSPDSNELTTDLNVANMKNKPFPVICPILYSKM